MRTDMICSALVDVIFKFKKTIAEGARRRRTRNAFKSISKSKVDDILFWFDSPSKGNARSNYKFITLFGRKTKSERLSKYHVAK